MVYRPNDAEAANGLGMVYETLGNLEQAEIYFSRALQIKPNFKTAKINLDRIFQKKAL